MNRVRVIALIVLFSCLGVNLSFGQNTSTQGKEFWLSFMHNGFKDHLYGGWVTNQVLISAKRDCTGTVSNPLTGWERTFSVEANSVATINIPEAQGYHDANNYEMVSQKGIKIQSTDTISVYCTNIAHVSFDASFVLPVGSLGDEYIIQCYDQSTAPAGNDYVDVNQTSAFLIVATEDNTAIDITPTCNTLGGHQAGQTFSINLNAGETYHVRSLRTGGFRDLTGTRVLAADCKRIAVFNGNTVTCIPIGQGNGYDHVFEQAMPTRSWGKNFVVTSSMNRNRDFIKIVSSGNDNVVTKNGQPLVTLNANQSYTFFMMESEESCFIEATQPSAVYLYNNSSYDRYLGDPSMVWIAPVEQRINEITFTTFDDPNIEITDHSVNIIVNTDDINSVYFDGQLISPLLFTRVNGNNDYSFVRMDISHDVHHISCHNGFNAHVYGFGDAKGYAYLVGSKAIDLSTHLTLNDVTMQPYESFKYCIDETVHFAAEVNFNEYDIFWDFGDGTTSTQNPVDHIYHDKRVYNVSVSITTEAGGCTSMSSDTTHFYVDATQSYIIESDAICAGSLYSGYGFSNVMVNNDTILGRRQNNEVFPECQDSVLVYVTAYPQYHPHFDDSRCWHGEPGVYVGHGFAIEYDHPGEYDREERLTTVNGCDSIVSLHLVVNERITRDEYETSCDSFVWEGQTYTESGDYPFQYTTQHGCDSIVTLHLTINPSQQVAFDTVSCDVFVWNGQSYTTDGSYTQTLTNIHGCDSIVTCNLNFEGLIPGTTIDVEECNSYFWIDSTYTDPGFYDKTLKTPFGCDSIIHLNLELGYTPDPSPIYPINLEDPTPHWVITATEFQINAYEFQFWDNYNSIWESITWEFEEPVPDWIIEPDTTTYPVGKNCKIYVLSQMQDTVWLRATVYNDCKKDGVMRRYWLVSSFYDVDEHDSSRADFSVVPNPNNGQMTLHFEHLTGKIDVKVYDMRGTIIDNFQTFNGMESESYLYDMSKEAEGIYFFVVTGKEGTLAKKVVIIH